MTPLGSADRAIPAITADTATTTATASTAGTAPTAPGGAADAADATAATAPGTVPLAGDWSLWPEVAVRSAGFAAGGVRRLGNPALARLADAPPGATGPAGDEFRAAFARGLAETGRQLRQIVADPRFRAALTWQNHHVIERAVLPLLRPGPHARNSRHRQREDLITGYWQRYCVKNDTIGSFGPVGWVRADPGAPTSFRPSAILVEHFEVFFETWALDAVARTLAGRDGMTAWLAPQRVPFVRVDGDRVLLPARPPVPVAPLAARALRRCDGVRPARVIAAELVAAGIAASEAEVFATLDELRRRRWIGWTLELPATPRPAAALRDRLAAIGDAALREPALAQLDALERGRAAVRDAAADPDRLGAALRELDARFTSIAGAAPTRNAGRAYGGRTLVYHDARRRVEFTVGAELLDALAPLELVLTSARWFTHTVAQALRALIRAAYARVAARTPRPVDLGSLWFECMSVAHGPGRAVVRETAAELQRRWAAVLGPAAAGTRRRDYRADELRPRVRERFPAPHGGWHGARYVSPDIMIAASDVAAIRRGDFQVVLAEIHLALVAYRHFCFVTQHPRPARLLDCLTGDFPAPRLLPVLPKDSPPRLTIRTHPALVRDEDYLVALHHQSADPARPKLLMGADLTVEPAGERLVVRTPAGEVFDVLDAFSEQLLDLVIDALDLVAPADHTPRITVDRLVLHRESWRFAAGTLDFAREADEASRFVRARAWRARAGLPEQVFVTSPLEQKPFFVDLGSVVSVNLLAKAVRRVRATDPAMTVKVAEMMPDLDQLWLTDADGGRYTSELRLTAVDRRPVPDPTGLDPTEVDPIGSDPIELDPTTVDPAERGGRT